MTTITKKKKPSWMHFTDGGLASAMAVCFSNPLDTVKTRLQLQNELGAAAAAGGQFKKLYRGCFHGLYSIWKNEGIVSLQKGLVGAITFQLAQGGSRFGMYTLAQEQFKDYYKDQFFLKNLFFGVTTSALSGIIGSPFYLVKTRFQSASTQTQGKAGYGAQHGYTSIGDCIKKIHAEGGVAGFFRGWESGTARMAVVGAAQMVSYDQSKKMIKKLLPTYFEKDNIILHSVSSAISGVITSVVGNPFDVVATRLYNQKVENGKGAYKGIIDCFVKSFRAEGPMAFFKGLTAHYFRMVPQTILLFIFIEQIRNVDKKIANF